MSTQCGFGKRSIIAVGAVGFGLSLFAATGNAATITYLGADHTAAWRSQDVSKNATFDINGDNAYGSDGYVIVDHTTGDKGATAQWISDLPGYISLQDSAGNGWWGTDYPDLDDAREPIAGTVADLTAPGIAFNGTDGTDPSLSFLAQSSTDFIVTFVGTHNNQAPGTITVNGTGSTTGSDSTTDNTSGVRIHFFEVTGISAGDTFDVSATGPNFHGVGFESAGIPEPASLVLLSLGGLGLIFRRRR